MFEKNNFIELNDMSRCDYEFVPKMPRPTEGGGIHQQNIHDFVETFFFSSTFPPPKNFHSTRIFKMEIKLRETVGDMQTAYFEFAKCVRVGGARANTKN